MPAGAVRASAPRTDCCHVLAGTLRTTDLKNASICARSQHEHNAYRGARNGGGVVLWIYFRDEEVGAIKPSRGFVQTSSIRQEWRTTSSLTAVVGVSVVVMKLLMLRLAVTHQPRATNSHMATHAIHTRTHETAGRTPSHVLQTSRCSAKEHSRSTR